MDRRVDQSGVSVGRADTGEYEEKAEIFMERRKEEQDVTEEAQEDSQDSQGGNQRWEWEDKMGERVGEITEIGVMNRWQRRIRRRQWRWMWRRPMCRRLCVTLTGVFERQQEMPIAAQRFQITEVTRPLQTKRLERQHEMGIEMERILKAHPAASRVQVDVWTTREQVGRQKMDGKNQKMTASNTALLVAGMHRRRDDDVSEMMDRVESEEEKARVELEGERRMRKENDGEMTAREEHEKEQREDDRVRWLTRTSDVEVRNQEDDDVPNKNMVWWRKSWWLRIEDGLFLQTARERRKGWRAATGTVEEVLHGMLRVSREDAMAVHAVQ